MTASTPSGGASGRTGKQLLVRYEGVSPNPKQTGCQPGTRALGLAIQDVYPELQSMEGAYGCYNRRKIAGTATWSLHAEGRALDIGVGERWHELAWSLVCDLVANRLLYGTMRVMWDRHIWSTERVDRYERLKPYTNQHLDHIHLEQFWRAAERPPTVQTQLEEALRLSR